jgi:hypothetical protein
MFRLTLLNVVFAFWGSEFVKGTQGLYTKSLDRPPASLLLMLRPVGLALRVMLRPVGLALRVMLRPVGLALRVMLRPVGLALRGSALPLYQGESRLLNLRGLTLPLRQGINILEESIASSFSD